MRVIAALGSFNAIGSNAPRVYLHALSGRGEAKMKRTIFIASVAFVAGMIGGVMGANIIAPAHAATNVLYLPGHVSASEVAAKCDFNKTVVVWQGIICVQK